MGIFNKFKYMCKYKVQEKAKLNLLDIINILDLFLKSAKDSIDNDVTGKVIPDMNTNKSKVTIHKFVFSIC